MTLYICRTFFGIFHFKVAWVLSTTSTFTATNPAKEKLAEVGINSDDLAGTSQSNSCNYENLAWPDENESPFAGLGRR